MSDDLYTQRINRVQDYVGDHLDGDLSLERLAEVACFSRFHFHRIFKAALGETLSDHVRRARLERAAQLMRAAPAARLTDVALQVGFPGLSEFSRAFKGHFGIAPSRWDRRSPVQESKIRQAPDALPRYDLDDLERMHRNRETSACLKRFPASRMLYIRVHDAYGNERIVTAYRELQSWLAARGVGLGEIVIVGMSRDDPEITPLAKCRYDMGAVFPLDLGDAGVLGEILARRGVPARRQASVQGIVRGWEPGGAGFEPDMNVRDFPAYPLGVVECVADLSGVDRAWQYLYRYWLPHSRRRPADIPAMELFRRLPEEIGWETFDLLAGIALEDEGASS